MRAFVVLGLVFSAPSQEIGTGKRLRNDLFDTENTRYFGTTRVRPTTEIALDTVPMWWHFASATNDHLEWNYND